MPSFEELLDQIAGGGARAQSSIPSYRNFIQDSAGGRMQLPVGGGGSRPTRPTVGRSRSASLSPEEIERALDPRLTEGLQQARNQFESAQHQAAALGQEDLSGEGPQGLLNSLFGIIDTPRNLAFNSVRTLLDPNMGFEEFTDALDKHEGFGDLAGLEMEEDDSGIERFFKGAGAFLGDVATDPLSYVTFGATTVGKKMGSQAVQQAVAKRAGTELSERTVRSFAKRSFANQAKEKAAQVGGLSDDALDVLKQTPAGPEEFALGQQILGDEAAEAFQRRGATGLREFFEELGDEGTRLWENLPTDMKGGLRIRIPFARDEGVRRAVSVAGGGGQLAKQMGLGGTVTRAHQIRNAIRASKASQALSRAMGGTNGDLYGQMVADVVQRNGDDLGGMTYSLYRTITQAQRASHLTKREVLNTGNRTLAEIDWNLRNAGDADTVQQAKSEFNRFVNDPEELDRLLERSQGVSVDEAGRLFLNMLGESDRVMSHPEIVGMQNAALYHHTLRDLFRQTREAGVDIEELNDVYLPRALTEAKKEQMATAKEGGLNFGSGPGGYRPDRRREQFVELVAEVDDDGIVRSRMRSLTPEEANARANARTQALREAEGQAADKIEKIDFFETDPAVMMSRYVNAMGHIASEAKFARMVREAGGTVAGDRMVTPLLKSRTLAQAGETLDEAQDALRGGLPEAGSQRQVIEQVLSDTDRLRTVISDTLADPALTPQQQMERVDTVMKTMDGFLETLPPAKQASESIDQAREAFRKSLRQAGEAKSARQSGGELSEAFRELGLSGAGTRPGEAAVRRLPPELDMNFAPEQMRLALNKFYEMKDPAKAKKFVGRTYRPWLSMFKIQATIGRGPGFHIRNAVGGMLNNDLMGVTAADHKAMAKINIARVKAGQQARKEMAREAVQKTGAKASEAATGPAFEESVARRADEILSQRLGSVQVTDDLTGYDIHRLMTEHEVDWRQNPYQELGAAEGSGFERIGAGNEMRRGALQGRLADRTGLDIPGVTKRIERGGRRQTRLYPHVPEEELSRSQKTAEAMANLWWVRFNAGAAEMTESYLRGAAFIRGLKRYGDPETARLLPLASQFDYNDLSDFERTWMRGSLLPFYTWIRNNVPLQVRSLIQQPGKMNRINLLLDNAEEAFGDDDVDVLPEWMRERFMFASRFKFDGNPLAFGIEAPAQDLNQWFKVGNPIDVTQESIKALASASNPAFAVPAEWAMGTELFTGADLDAQSGRHAPWWYQALPDQLAPSWADPETGEIKGDARLITGWEDSLPWLGQSDKVLAIMGLNPASVEGNNRRVSDAISQLFPVIKSGTITPEQEAGELFTRAERLRAAALRQADPEDAKIVQGLKDAGFELEEISAVMERLRARRN